MSLTVLFTMLSDIHSYDPFKQLTEKHCDHSYDANQNK
jgi:hypothetical protein